MKILMVSIFAPHFFNWTEQLRDSGHEIYWLDVFDSNTQVSQIDFVNQITGWRYKKEFRGRYYLKKNYPTINKLVNRFNERNFATFFEKKLNEIQPDVVHSFVMYLGAAKIYEVMKRYSKIKWIYSSWGSDLFYYRSIPEKLNEMKLVLPEIDFLFTDCKRDYEIAIKNGFQGDYLGTYPGGGGYDVKSYNKYIKTVEQRKIILIKGYQGIHGKCKIVLEAIAELKNELKNFEIIVFGADSEVIKHVHKLRLDKWDNFEVKLKISHFDVMKLMGESMVYIGNSTSDGMPNTLLEAIIMGAFPIQSNPGNATSEMIEHTKNGLLIAEPLDKKEIKNHIGFILRNQNLLKEAFVYNQQKVKPGLDRKLIRAQVLEKYRLVQNSLES